MQNAGNSSCSLFHFFFPRPSPYILRTVWVPIVILTIHIHIFMFVASHSIIYSCKLSSDLNLGEGRMVYQYPPEAFPFFLLHRFYFHDLLLLLLCSLHEYRSYKMLRHLLFASCIPNALPIFHQVGCFLSDLSDVDTENLREIVQNATKMGVQVVISSLQLH